MAELQALVENEPPQTSKTQSLSDSPPSTGFITRVNPDKQHRSNEPARLSKYNVEIVYTGISQKVDKSVFVVMTFPSATKIISVVMEPAEDTIIVQKVASVLGDAAGFEFDDKHEFAPGDYCFGFVLESEAQAQSTIGVHFEVLIKPISNFMLTQMLFGLYRHLGFEPSHVMNYPVKSAKSPASFYRKLRSEISSVSKTLNGLRKEVKELSTSMSTFKSVSASSFTSMSEPAHTDENLITVDLSQDNLKHLARESQPKPKDGQPKDTKPKDTKPKDTKPKDTQPKDSQTESFSDENTVENTQDHQPQDTPMVVEAHSLISETLTVTKQIQEMVGETLTISRETQQSVREGLDTSHQVHDRINQVLNEIETTKQTLTYELEQRQSSKTTETQLDTDPQAEMTEGAPSPHTQTLLALLESNKDTVDETLSVTREIRQSLDDRFKSDQDRTGQYSRLIDLSEANMGCIEQIQSSLSELCSSVSSLPNTSTVQTSSQNILTSLGTVSEQLRKLSESFITTRQQVEAIHTSQGRAETQLAVLEAVEFATMPQLNQVLSTVQQRLEGLHRQINNHLSDKEKGSDTITVVDISKLLKEKETYYNKLVEAEDYIDQLESKDM